MKLLFVHQNMPGQYREMVQWLAEQGGHELVFLTQLRNPPKIPGVRSVVYPSHHAPKEDAYGLSKVWEEAVGRGYGAAQAAKQIKDRGFTPDVILGHTGWGELLFMKEVWPDVPILGFFEFFYKVEGTLVGFDRDDPPSETRPYLLKARNAVPFASLHCVDEGIAPTRWQKELFPPLFQPKLHQCHDGIRTDKLKANPDVSLALGRLERPLTRADEIITYMARNMEKTRGFQTMMRALPEILEARPNARVILIGGSSTSYGRPSDAQGGFRGEMEREVGSKVDWSRVHFVGRVPYPDFQKIIQVSSCHIYLTMPFVLSWSLLECMAMEATIVSSDVAPVREVITDGETGMLVDFYDPSALAAQVVDVVANPKRYERLGAAARAHVVKEYDFLTKCLPDHISRINALAPSVPSIKI